MSPDTIDAIRLAGSATSPVLYKDLVIVNAGIARLTLAAFDAVADSVPCSLEVDVLPALAGRGALGGVVLEGDFIDIGVPEDYRLFCARHGGAA